ncbi:hypothetical protein AAHH84_00150 [Candidatus Hodgkinia cicadicola]
MLDAACNGFGAVRVDGVKLVAVGTSAALMLCGCGAWFVLSWCVQCVDAITSSNKAVASANGSVVQYSNAVADQLCHRALVWLVCVCFGLVFENNQNNNKNNNNKHTRENKPSPNPTKTAQTQTSASAGSV